MLEDPLGGLQPRDVSVAEHGKPVRREGEHLVEGAREAAGALVRQAENEVDVDRGEAGSPQPRTGLAVKLRRLDPMDRKLHAGVRVLHP